MDSANVYHVKHSVHLSIQEFAPNNNTQTDLIIMDCDKTSSKVPHHELFYTLQYYGYGIINKSYTESHPFFHIALEQ